MSYSRPPDQPVPQVCGAALNGRIMNTDSFLRYIYYKALADQCPNRISTLPTSVNVIFWYGFYTKKLIITD